MKKAQVTKADVLRFKEWLETKMTCERTNVDTRHYPAFQEILEEYDDKPPVWQIKKPKSYKSAHNYQTGGTHELSQGESYVDICGDKYIQNDKENFDSDDPRRKSVKLLFQKTAKLTNLAFSYHYMPPEHTILEEYPHVFVKPWNRKER
jgi:hypothetical protein